ncbi:MAG: hypothetical protein NPIRA03_37020 [Nitrospirales bacterium]|nr:MAG: hypothetical protein NPIRA03_37020 [Nitrospirales bacterium]
MRPVRIVTKKPLEGSSRTRGFQLAGHLQNLGVDVSVIKQDIVEIEPIKNAIIVFVKHFDIDLVELAKENNNLIIWNPIDSFAVNKPLPPVGLFDGVIFPTSQALEDFGYLCKNPIGSLVIDSFADLRWRPAKCWRFQIAYLGTRKNIAECYKGIRGLKFEFIHTNDGKKHERFFKRASHYVCHFSVWEKDTPSFLYKPNTKLVGAAASDANIVLSKSPSHYDILDSDYPYFTDTDIDSVQEIVKFARSTYKAKEWKKGLRMLSEVREATSPKRIANKYAGYFLRFE